MTGRYTRVGRRLLASLAVALSVAAPALAQGFNPFGATEARAAKTEPFTYERATLSGPTTTVPMQFTTDSAVRIENEDDGAVYSLSATTDTPGPLMMVILQLQFDARGAVTGKTRLMSRQVVRADADTISLPDTLLPTGPVFIGVGGDGRGTITITRSPARAAKTFKPKMTLPATGDLLMRVRSPETCFSLPRAKAGTDLDIVLPAGISATLRAGKTSDTAYLPESWDGQGSISVRGLDASRTGPMCLRTGRAKPPVRLRVRPSRRAEEPDSGMATNALAVLRPGQLLARSITPGDTDAVRLPISPDGRAWYVDLEGALSATMCLGTPDNAFKSQRDCTDRTRTIGPTRGGDDVRLTVGSLIGGTGDYTLGLRSVALDTGVARLEPNEGALSTQAPPPPHPRTGQVRLTGNHIGRGDVDRYHWADVDSEQLWRVRAIGKGLQAGSLYMNGKRVTQMTRPPGTSGRLVADDVLMRAGRAEIELRGAAGDYTVLLRPLGPPPPGFELEAGADGTGALLRYGETLTGRLRAGDRDTYLMSRPRELSATLRIEPPLGGVFNLQTSAGFLPAATISHPGQSFDITVPAGDSTLTLSPKVASPMDYTITLTRRNPYAVDGAPLDLRVAEVEPVRGWSDDLQSVPLSVSLRNTGRTRVRGRLRVEAETFDFTLEDLPVDLAPGASTRLTPDLRLMPDTPPGTYTLMVGVVGEGETPLGGTRLDVTVAAEALASAAQSRPALPDRMIGAIDVAHQFYDARWVSDDKDPGSLYTTDTRAHRAFNLNGLLDGLWGYGRVLQAQFQLRGRKTPSAFDLKLGGEAPIPLVGVGLLSIEPGWKPLGNFAVETSVDGKTFRPWITARHDRFGGIQFVEGETRTATHLRLIARPDGPLYDWTWMSELYVLAKPGESGLPGQDLLRHGNRAKRHLEEGTPVELSTMKRDGYVRVPLPRDGRITGSPISFSHFMEADIEAIGLGWGSARDAEEAPKTVIALGADHVDGPWREIGSWDVVSPTRALDHRYELPERARIRFLRFDFVSEHRNTRLPYRLSAFERAESPDYLSVLGQWDERTQRSTVAALATQPGGALAMDSLVRGEVEFEVDDDRWQINIPEGANTLELDIDAQAGFTPRVEVFQGGKAAEARSSNEPGSDVTALRPAFAVAPGPAEIRIREDKRSIYVIVNDGKAMAQFRSRILNGIAGIGRDMVAGRDAVAFNTLSTRAERPWITDPDQLARDVVSFFADAKSSATDADTLAAVGTFMADRSGSKAILMISDGKNSRGNAELETALAASGARLFIAKPPGSVQDRIMAPENDVLTGWAQLTGGDVQFTTSLAGYERLFPRVSAKLLGPKSYTLRARATSRVLAPGFLKVDRLPDVPADAEGTRTQMILLDTSGSMLKRLEGGQRRYQIAAAALRDYLSEQGRAGAKTAADGRFDAIGLRLFGGPPDSCETSLSVPPVAPSSARLSRAVAAVTPRNNARTPIAKALRAAAGDMKNQDGPGSILLVTDGEETCEGDPLAAIATLREAGIDTRLDVVSFALSADVKRATFEAWAKAGGGHYFDVQSGDALQQALMDSGVRSLSVLRDGEVVATGKLGGAPIELEAGAYELRIDGIETVYPVTIRAGQTTSPRFD